MLLVIALVLGGHGAAAEGQKSAKLAASVALPSEGGGSSERPADSEAAQRLAAEHFCPCGCGNRLPGGAAPACFGCSVGNAELSFIRESLAAGRKPAEIDLDLADPVLVEVFGDYTTEGLPETWQRAKRVAAELGHHRVVLRTPARSPHARRAAALAECAREASRFTAVQAALVHHSGPWDEDALLKLAAREGLLPEPARACLRRIDVGPQIAKDREHAGERGVGPLPRVSVNRRAIPDTEADLRGAIYQVVLEESL